MTKHRRPALPVRIAFCLCEKRRAAAEKCVAYTVGWRLLDFCCRTNLKAPVEAFKMVPANAARRSDAMNLTYAVDRLSETGWLPDYAMELETLPDGRRFPSVRAVQREFARAGL